MHTYILSKLHKYIHEHKKLWTKGHILDKIHEKCVKFMKNSSKYAKETLMKYQDVLTSIVSTTNAECTSFIIKRINPKYYWLLTSLPYSDLIHDSVRFYGTEKNSFFWKLVLYANQKKCHCLRASIKLKQEQQEQIKLFQKAV